MTVIKAAKIVGPACYNRTVSLKQAYIKFLDFSEWSLVRRPVGPDKEWTSCEPRLDPAVALARIVTFKMLEDKALI